MDKPDIDYGRIATLLDVVQKIATIAPKHTYISGMAMDEINALNDEAKEWVVEEGKRKLAEEQEAAARINADNAAQDAAQAPKAVPAKSFETVAPGQPVSDRVKAEAGQKPTIDPVTTTDVAKRRV